MGNVAQNVSVLMGDIIGSEKMARGHLHDRFNSAVKAVNSEYGALLLSPLTITLGDEFQGMLPSSAKAFRIANTLRLRLLFEAVPCRFVVGQVDIQTPINREIAWNMLGDGLAEARERLNRKQDTNAYRFSLLRAEEGEPLGAQQRLLDAFGSVLSQTEDGWSDKQLETIRLWLSFDGDAEKVAGARNVTKRSVYYTLETAGWETYRERCEALQTYLAHCINP